MTLTVPTPEQNNNDLVAIDQYAAQVGVSIETVRGWTRRNYVPSVQIGKRLMIDCHSMRKYLDEVNRDWYPGKFS